MRSRQRMMTWVFVIVVLMTAGCGGSSGDTSAPAGDGTSQTTPNANAATRVSSMPTFSFTQPTLPPAVATAAATLTTGISESTSEVAAINPEAVERGRSRYEALECASCHGENGEGSAEVASLVGYAPATSEADFVTFMRSGGELGVEHQYASNRLSATGATNLYQYLMSLQSP